MDCLLASRLSCLVLTEACCSHSAFQHVTQLHEMGIEKFMAWDNPIMD